MLWWKVFVRVFTSWTAPRLPAIVSSSALCPRRACPGLPRACRFLPQANKISECVPPGTQICVQCSCSV